MNSENKGRSNEKGELRILENTNLDVFSKDRFPIRRERNEGRSNEENSESLLETLNWGTFSKLSIPVIKLVNEGRSIQNQIQFKLCKLKLTVFLKE